LKHVIPPEDDYVYVYIYKQNFFKYLIKLHNVSGNLGLSINYIIT